MSLSPDVHDPIAAAKSAEAPAVPKTPEVNTPEAARSDIHLKFRELMRINENPEAEYNPTQNTVDTMAEIMADQTYAFLRIPQGVRQPYHSQMLSMFNHGETTPLNEDASREALLAQARKILASPDGFKAGLGAMKMEQIIYQKVSGAQVTPYGPDPTALRASDRFIRHGGAHPQGERLTLNSWITQKRRQLSTLGIYGDKGIPVPRWRNGRIEIDHTVEDVRGPTLNPEGVRRLRNATDLGDFIERRAIRGYNIPVLNIDRGISENRRRIDAQGFTRADFIRPTTYIPGIQPESRRIEEQARIDAQEAERDWQTGIQAFITIPDNAQMRFNAVPALVGDTGLSEAQRLYLEAKGWRNGDRIPNEVRLDAEHEDVSLQNQIKTRLARIIEAQIEIGVSTGRSGEDIIDELNLVTIGDDGTRSIARGITEDPYGGSIGANAQETAELNVTEFSAAFIVRAERDIARAQETPQVAMPEVVQSRLDKLKEVRVLSSAEVVQKDAATRELAATTSRLKQAEQSQGLQDRLAQIQATRENLDRTIGPDIITIHEETLPATRATIARLTQELSVNTIHREDVKSGLSDIRTSISQLGTDRNGQRVPTPVATLDQQSELIRRQQELGETLARLSSEKTEAQAEETRLTQRLAETTLDEAKGKNPQPETFEALLKQRTTLMNREAALVGDAVGEDEINTLRQEVARLKRQVEDFDKPPAIAQMEIDSYEAAKNMFSDIAEVRKRGIWARDRRQQEGFNEADTAPVHRNLPPVYARMMQVLGGTDILSKDRMEDYKKLSLLFSTEDFLQTWNQANPTARIDSIYNIALFDLGLDSVNAGLVDRTITTIERRVRAGEVGIRDKQGQVDVVDDQERTHYQAIYNLRHRDRSQAPRPVVYENTPGPIVVRVPRVDGAGNQVTVTDEDIVSSEEGFAQYRDVYDLARIFMMEDGTADFSASAANEEYMLQWLRVADQVDQRRQRIASTNLSVSARIEPSRLPLQP